MRCFLVVIICAGSLLAVEDSPSGTRITPPTLREIAPLGVPRGVTTEISVVGYNLAHASAIYFSEPGVKATITRIREMADQDDVRLGGNGTPLTVDLGPLPVRNEITADLDVPPGTNIGPVNFRVLTPLGLSPQGTIAIEPFYGESPDREPNDTIEDITESSLLPTILVGAISKPGDVDLYRIDVKAGQQVVFESHGSFVGSTLQPVITIEDADGQEIRKFTEDAAKSVHSFAHTFDKAGSYFVKIADFEESGGGRNFYRIIVGPIAVVTSAWPMGVQSGKEAAIKLQGFNLASSTMEVKGEPSDGEYDALWLRPRGREEAAFTRIKLAVGDEPETDAATKTEQPVHMPVTINGKLRQPHQDFRFHAKKGEQIVLEVNAARLGSPLDSQLEVLESSGRPVERATLRAELATSVTLRDHDSTGTGLRLDSFAGLEVGDYLMVGGEVLRIAVMPHGPDEDTLMDSFGGQRLAFLDTSPEAHAIDTPVYKIQIRPPGMKFPANGLPLVHLMYRNDDGGPGYSKDSALHFVAPAEGDYLARISDVRGQTGEEYAYRLTIREKRPDFRLSVSPRNPNVPVGGRVPLTVTALRLDEFNGPIPVTVKDLPPGFHATSGVIAPGQKSTTLLLSADDTAKLETAAPLRVVDAKGRDANADDRLKLISLMPRADVDMMAQTKEMTLEVGGRVTFEVSVHRNNGFAGRVPLAVRNLPPTVRIIDVGLNGVLVNENETKRSFTLEALPDAQPLEQPVYVSGDVETRAGMQQNAFSTEPITLKIVKSNKQQLSSIR